MTCSKCDSPNIVVDAVKAMIPCKRCKADVKGRGRCATTDCRDCGHLVIGCWRNSKDAKEKTE